MNSVGSVWEAKDGKVIVSSSWGDKVELELPNGHKIGMLDKTALHFLCSYYGKRCPQCYKLRNHSDFLSNQTTCLHCLKKTKKVPPKRIIPNLDIWEQVKQICTGKFEIEEITRNVHVVHTFEVSFLFSYNQPVCIRDNMHNTYDTTDRVFSPTTTKHIRQFVGKNACECVTHESILDFVEECLNLPENLLERN